MSETYTQSPHCADCKRRQQNARIKGCHRCLEIPWCTQNKRQRRSEGAAQTLTLGAMNPYGSEGRTRQEWHNKCAGDLADFDRWLTRSKASLGQHGLHGVRTCPDWKATIRGFTMEAESEEWIV